MRRALACVLLLATHCGAACDGEWADLDTPTSACTTTSEVDGAILNLVFSDEFEVQHSMTSPV